jgi:hypothetical protein
LGSRAGPVGRQLTHHSWIDLSHRIAEFNISVSAYATADVVMIPDRVYSQSRND